MDEEPKLEALAVSNFGVDFDENRFDPNMFSFAVVVVVVPVSEKGLLGAVAVFAELLDWNRLENEHLLFK